MVELLSNSSHLHVLLNHVPTVGFGLGLALFLVALARKNDSLKRTSLAVFFVGYFFVRPVAIRLILRETAHANPDRFFLRFDFQRLFVRLDDPAHEKT